MAKSVKELQDRFEEQIYIVEEQEDYISSFNPLIANEWRCSGDFKGKSCKALLGRTDGSPSKPHRILHQKRSCHHESWTYDEGGVAVVKKCRRCGTMNFLFSDSVSKKRQESIIQEFACI